MASSSNPPADVSSNPPLNTSSNPQPEPSLNPQPNASSNPPLNTSSNHQPDPSLNPQPNASSNPPCYTEDSFLHASNANVCNYVSVKVSNNHTYRLWKRQILCLLTIHNMVALVDDTIQGPISNEELMNKYDSLLKGWIFGSISEDLLVQVIDLGLAKDVWDKLKSIYGPTMGYEIVKLSSHNYSIWKSQMLLLMRNHNLDGLVDDIVEGPFRALSKAMLDQHESLLKNWIFDSVSKDLLVGKIHLRPAKDIWDYLKWNYDSTLTTEIVKLSGQHNYHLWRTEMLGLVNSYNIDGLMDDTMDGSKASWNEIMDQYDNLLRSWIFDSISHDALLEVNKLSSAKEVWEKLKAIYGPTISYQIGHDKSKASDTKDIITTRNKKLRRATKEGQWWEVEAVLRNDINAVGDVINDEGETLVHIAVGTGHKYFVRNLLDIIEDKEILKRRSLDGSTALHIAAITGNKYAAGLLIEKEKSLIGIRNREGTLPYVAAYFNNHFDTSVFLFKATNPKRQSKGHGLRKDLTDRNLLLDVISTKQYDLALQLLEAYEDLAVKDDAEVLMTLARNFPGGLGYWEMLIHPSLYYIHERIVNKTSLLFTSVEFFRSGALTKPVEGVLLVLVTMAILVYQLILFPIWIVYLAFLMLYFFLWKVATIFVPPIKHMEKRKKEWTKAKEVLKMVCDKIDESEPIGIHHSLYKRPFLEAACQNAYEVVAEILSRSPKASRWTDKNGYNIIHLAVIHRSEKVYNLIHDIVDRKILSKSHIDSYNNNVLHLAGKLAPLSKLKSRTGAALQLQQELQWREEVKKRVVPTFTTQKNKFEETPGMVFTREHDNLVKEGEKWMKTTAKSCSITAALITTIVFAAAITVPGGSHQTTGIPLFTKEAVFIVFAISDAISLCASTTSLLMFLSILTTRFAEQDFLKKLPTQLIFGLFFLLLSTTGMMVAFGATLFLVFSHQKAWMLAPICGLVCMPITTFVILQFPLIADLIKSTYFVFIFRKRSNSQHGLFNSNDFRLLVYKLNEYIRGSFTKQ